MDTLKARIERELSWKVVTLPSNAKIGRDLMGWGGGLVYFWDERLVEL